MQFRLEGVTGEMMTMLNAASRIKVCLTLLITSLFCCHLVAKETTQADQKLLSIIEEAKDFSMVKPMHSVELLEANKALLEQASEYYQFLYYKAGFWSSVYLYDSERIFHFARSMANTQDFPDSKRYFHEVLNSMSLWYRVNQDYQSSIAAGRCAIEFSRDELEINRNSVSAGLTYLLLDNYAEAQRIFEMNIELSKKADNEIGLAAAQNNLGLLNVYAGDYKKAETHFRVALKLNEEMARAKGTALNLVNLLFAFYMQQDWDNFYRLANRAERASLSLSNKDIKQYVFWVDTAFIIKTQGQKAIYIDALLASYNKVEEPTVLKLINLLAETLEIELPAKQPKIAKTIDFALAFPICQVTTDPKLLVSKQIAERLEKLRELPL